MTVTIIVPPIPNVSTQTFNVTTSENVTTFLRYLLAEAERENWPELKVRVEGAPARLCRQRTAA